MQRSSLRYYSASDCSAVLQAGRPGSEACTTIQSGELLYSVGHALAGESLTIGFDAYGYNYQAHLFNGSFANVYLGRVGFAAYDGDDDSYLAENSGAADHWAWPYRDIELNMKWNDAWLANTDCDGNGSLDRHSGSPTYIGSGAWLTNHMVGGTGSDTWTYSTKIVAAPADADNAGGIW